MDKNMQRVGVGVGAFHNPPKASYSEETKNLIKVLMEESKLTMMQRKTIQDAMNRGDSLPPPTPIPKKEKQSNNIQVTYPSVWKRRSRDMILNSGAYEREQFRRTEPLPNKEKQKRHLACMMAYGKDMPATPREQGIMPKPRRLPQLNNKDDPVKDIVQGIQERIEFLQDMECLGLGKKYKSIMHQEIAQKIRELETMEKSKSLEISKELEKFKYEHPPPKPFPLGELDV
ncbi:PREDICTED: UPF0193 protein EVG1 [Ceratosolen solmsi marchali]|uniref:UPF0193 protein EVG1 n=1 Tax=Ceratosolen solmsi marchali TaxID=326594 RepID=A0AAJ6YHS3_9HYME|nr:PREDICTED: UPF0193 protein EVG1 [Ceratosolen solmsi marchali]